MIEKDDIETVSTIVHPNTPEQQDEIVRIMHFINEMYQLQANSWPEFSDRSLKWYEDDNQKRINSYVPPRVDIEEWQTKGFEGITREKMFAFVSKVAMNRPRYKFKATKHDGEMDKAVAEVVHDFYEHSWDIEDPAQIQFLLDAWAAAGSGTTIRYEGVKKTLQEEEDFDSVDIPTGEIVNPVIRKIRSDIDCISRRVRLTDFLISDWYLPSYCLQEQPRIAEMTTMTHERFMAEFGEFDKADKVPLMVDTLVKQWGETFFRQDWEGLEQEELVLVIRFYEKDRGRTRYRVIANGVLLLATPIPRKDGKYPYSAGIFKPFADSDFFYGKALPDDIAHDQDLYNAFKNMVIDRAILHVQRPLITDAMNEVEDDRLSPNKILYLAGNVQPLNIPPPDQNDIQILQYLRGAADRQTSDSQQSGFAGSGVTAREIVIADENARKIAGVSRLFLEAFDLEAAKLRTVNIMQYFFDPVVMEEVLEDGVQKNFDVAFKRITRDGQKINGTSLGSKIIKVVGSKAEVLKQKAQDVIETLMAMREGIEIEKLTVNAQYAKNFDIDLTLIPESSFEQSKSLEKALELEYLQSVQAFFPQFFQQNAEVLFRHLNETFDRDSSEFQGGSQQGMIQSSNVGRGTENRVPVPVADSLSEANTQSLGALTGATV